MANLAAILAMQGALGGGQHQLPGQTPGINPAAGNPMSGAAMQDPAAAATQQPLIGANQAAGLAGAYGDQLGMQRAQQQMQQATALRDGGQPGMVRGPGVAVAASPLSHMAAGARQWKGEKDRQKASAAEEEFRNKIGGHMQDLAMYATPDPMRDDQRRMSLAPGRQTDMARILGGG